MFTFRHKYTRNSLCGKHLLGTPIYLYNIYVKPHTSYFIILFISRILSTTPHSLLPDYLVQLYFLRELEAVWKQQQASTSRIHKERRKRENRQSTKKDIIIIMVLASRSDRTEWSASRWKRKGEKPLIYISSPLPFHPHFYDHFTF